MQLGEAYQVAPHFAVLLYEFGHTLEVIGKGELDMDAFIFIHIDAIDERGQDIPRKLRDPLILSKAQEDMVFLLQVVSGLTDLFFQVLHYAH